MSGLGKSAPRDRSAARVAWSGRRGSRRAEQHVVPVPSTSRWAPDIDRGDTRNARRHGPTAPRCRRAHRARPPDGAGDAQRSDLDRCAVDSGDRCDRSRLRAERRAAALAALLDATLPGTSVIVIGQRTGSTRPAPRSRSCRCFRRGPVVARACDRGDRSCRLPDEQRRGPRPRPDEPDGKVARWPTSRPSPPHFRPMRSTPWSNHAGGSPLFLSELLRVGRATASPARCPSSLGRGNDRRAGPTPSCAPRPRAHRGRPQSQLRRGRPGRSCRFQRDRSRRGSRRRPRRDP